MVHCFISKNYQKYQEGAGDMREKMSLGLF